MEKVLVANRGEIAVRIFRTCRDRGLRTVAVATPDDRSALHAGSADETEEIGSYLHSDEHIRAARRVNGFLSENADFGRAVEAAGIVWVGPPAEAMETGGNKLASKKLAEAAGVPVVATGEPHDLGYPLLVKAAAGGGGRGMRVVRRPENLTDALEAARREAEAAFGDGSIFFERFVERPRHVEIPDPRGPARQRRGAGRPRMLDSTERHQKVLEEAPSPTLDEELRARIGAAAVSFARAIRYQSAGTAEFMLAGREFYFLELNTRIQVEHPVTELITGVDLVAQQFRIAQGCRLTVPTRTPTHGHAIEVRLYAEDPRAFLPRAGRIEKLRLPLGIRVDAGVAEGDVIGTNYDPMIAKLIAWAPTRSEALARMESALADTEVTGMTTNLPFLRWLIVHPAVRAGDTTTAFLDEHPPLTSTPPLPPGPWRGAFRLNSPSPPLRPPPDASASIGRPLSIDGKSVVAAAMPGTVIRVLVAEGDEVEARAPLVVLEAMKMEMPLVAPTTATVRAVRVSVCDRVAAGEVLVELDAATET